MLHDIFLVLFAAALSLEEGSLSFFLKKKENQKREKKMESIIYPKIV